MSIKFQKTVGIGDAALLTGVSQKTATELGGAIFS